MGTKFRKTIKMGPVRVNLSNSGVGYSVGGKGLRVTKKAGGGTKTTVGIPGTGISYSSESTKSAKTSARKMKESAAKTTPENETQSTTSSGPVFGTGCLVFFLIAFAIILGLINWKWLLFVAGISVLAFLGRNINMNNMNPPVP